MKLIKALLRDTKTRQRKKLKILIGWPKAKFGSKGLWSEENFWTSQKMYQTYMLIVLSLSASRQTIGADVRKLENNFSKEQFKFHQKPTAKKFQGTLNLKKPSKSNTKVSMKSQLWVLQELAFLSLRGWHLEYPCRKGGRFAHYCWVKGPDPRLHGITMNLHFCQCPLGHAPPGTLLCSWTSQGYSWQRGTTNTTTGFLS